MIVIRMFKMLDHQAVSIAHFPDGPVQPDAVAPATIQLSYCTFPESPDNEDERVVEMLAAAIEAASARAGDLGGWPAII